MPVGRFRGRRAGATIAAAGRGLTHRQAREETRRMEITYPRRKTRPVRVGKAVIGGDAPVLVQSMITEETRNVDACVAQIIRMVEAGCELVRVTTPTMAEAHCLEKIKNKLV